MSDRKALSRRGFLKVVGGASAGLVLGCYAMPKSANAATLTKEEEEALFAPNAWIQIDPQGFVTITVSKSDMGQGVRTSMAMIVAEELDVDWQKVRVVQAQANQPVYGNQGVGGSGSVRGMYMPLRKAGAAAKQMLLAAAAKQWGTDVTNCSTENGRVKNASNSLSYGELASVAATMQVPNESEVKLKDPKDFKIIGKPTKRVDNPDVVTGKAQYGLDPQVPGAKVAVVVRPTAFGGSVKSFDDTPCKAVTGYIKAVKIPSGVAVIADNTWSALKAAKALSVDFDAGPNAGLDSAAIRQKLQSVAQAPTGQVVAKYDLPYLAHATMEPMNCIANVKADSVTIWAPTQAPTGIQGSVARAMNLQPDKVIVNVTLLGGGFGRRFQSDFFTEAVQISKEAGIPIKLLWTRADDMKHDFYRPATHHVCSGSVADGKATAWQHQLVSASGREGLGNPGRGEIPYQIDGATLTRGGAGVPVPTGAWRSVEHTSTGFVHESFIDELAHAAGVDPFEFRKNHLADGRLKTVLVTAAEKAGWGTPLPKGKGRGIACFQGYGSFAAHVAEVTVSDSGKVKVDRIVAVYDCGICINPLSANAQMEGAAVDGMSTALKAEITIKNGGVEQSSFADYEWFHMGDMPKIEVHRIESGEAPGGMGETGYPSVAPAIANAIFAASGKRMRTLPIRRVE